ncbi:MAG: GNAT family N-acetyltransferase [Ignavibacteriales bacterium]|nr:GNAT family N-acetyltransferase [Ignavibacteriales bacterium]
MIITETNRLILREFIFEDAENLYKLNSDPEVIKYTGDNAFQSVEEAKIFIQNYDAYSKYGYGRWAVELKATKQFIGWCGLKYIPSLNETDIGFRLIKDFWEKGYATEAAKASLEFGFNVLKMEVIVGRAMKENVASIKVLEKIGMVFWKEFIFDEHPGLYFKIEKGDFK